ncbi:hypothetical protein EMIHUDRAFT_206253 [Emiliania huxleyi CCMP1516]|uniref:RING-type domain-containing protein n=2 Tax=Emiliania huxleyi TaxID=2903 RepID=A0A0D3JNP7_EMIH1|nr:hypothetical protein EMIHUDRAFT_206253 [Emiliania huxleyi CCMP1516]EOD25132.1 hypothetical protein EMIHUDRAFT_206253 [Emiliania huxleyi CCMP1516]|eukprot:XP_005777561.1 hypothetical protein EMIHUDRAFT_206253 [Emiliania huxleyi CCMP1516]
MPPVKPLVARPPLSFVEAKRQEFRKGQAPAADPIDPFFMDAPFSKIGTGHEDSTRGQVCAVKVNLCNLLSCGLWKAAWGCNDISKTAYLEPIPHSSSIAPSDYLSHVTTDRADAWRNYLAGIYGSEQVAAFPPSDDHIRFLWNTGDFTRRSDTGCAGGAVCTRGHCPICLEALSDAVLQMPCSHLFHLECLTQWLGTRNSCPVCRHLLPTEDEPMA